MAGNKFKLESLPPSKEALKQHIYRTYHQVQMWHGEEKMQKIGDGKQPGMDCNQYFHGMNQRQNVF